MCRYLEPFDALAFLYPPDYVYIRSANKTNMVGSETIYSVPDENIYKDLEELCIRRWNLKYLDKEIADANQKIIGYQTF